ncbi:hypothetical protein WAF17_10760 [Bernardetia sp. ABR2-2B]|uniref:hypothetical protein n=1 Tax=Bernardetia sp. ABR2-2B TaxID=3127472 RepID=UPI0030CDD13E
MNSAAAANTPIASHTCPHKHSFRKINLEGTLPVNRPMTKGDLIAFYNVSYKTFKKWLEPVLEKLDYTNKKTFFARDLRIIREHLDGVPLEY